jgi:O-antigen/teichoic acid export membrane protein
MIKSLFKNTAARTVAEIITRLGSAIFWVMVVRYIGLDGLGSLVYGTSLFTLFSILSTFGLSLAIVRKVSMNLKCARQYFGHTLMLGASSSLLMGLMMWLSTFIMKVDADTRFVVYMFIIALPFASGFYWSRVILWSFEKLVKVTIARIFENAIRVGVGLLLLIKGADVRTLAVLIMSSKIISFLICYYFARSTVGTPDWRPNMNIFKNLFAQIPTFSLLTLFHNLFWSATVIILTNMQGETRAGIFGAAFKLVDLCIAIIIAYGQAFFPVISKITQKKSDYAHYILKKSLKYSFLLTLAVTFGVYLLAGNIIEIIYGNELLAATNVLEILIWLILPFSAIPVLSSTLLSSNLERYDLLANIFASTTVVFANILLIPKLGPNGSALSMVLGGVVFFMTEFFAVYRKIIPIKVSFQVIKPLVAVLLMSLVVFLIRDNGIFICVLSGAIVYLVFLWKTNVFSDFQTVLMNSKKMSGA